MAESAQKLDPKVVSAYLIIARYNRTKWHGLKAEDVLKGVLEQEPSSTDTKNDSASENDNDDEEDKSPTQQAAEKMAEKLFPEKPISLPQVSAGGSREGITLPKGLNGSLLVHTFYTDLHNQIADQLEQIEPDKATMRGKLDALVDKFYAHLDSSVHVKDTPVRDPGVGWMAVVDATSFASTVNDIINKAGPLWRMYDIEIIPLNNDQTTEDIYKLMTPVHWGK